MHRWGKFWTKDTKRKKKKKTNAIFEEPEAETGYYVGLLHTTT